jgi:uncharacterized iron-regulated membrane protein
MVNRHTSKKIRKTHRYLGLFIGIQFLMWTISGLYFSWTDIDEIHGDHFLNESFEPSAFTALISPEELKVTETISSLELKDIAGKPHYWVNERYLFNARSGELKKMISEKEAAGIAKMRMHQDLEMEEISLITETGEHHEYRGQMLPAYVISYKDNGNLKAYISARDGSFKSVRYRDWRWFDFLWMTHTMDYEGRDDFNNLLLRSFSLLGLITVLSGFLLWFISSPTIRRIFPKKR